MPQDPMTASEVVARKLGARTKSKPPTQDTITRALVKRIGSDPSMNTAMKLMRERASEFSDPFRAELAGIAAIPQARAMFERELDEMWRNPQAEATKAAEVIIGGGLHAAIYSAVRVAKGFAPPLVLEMTDRPGGAIACSTESAFYLNSRNRPGSLGLPGQAMGALNVLPGAVVQPADLSGDEYQRNIDLAFAIRSTLALRARTVVNAEVTDQEYGSKGYAVRLADGRRISTQRIIDATGIGRPLSQFANDAGFADPDGEKLMTFDQFMRRMDTPFPLRGMGRVAVIGAGDSGKTVIEALIGQGPSTGWSVASLDYTGRIDWYGCKDFQIRATYEECVRSRYRGIGRAIPRDRGDNTARVFPTADLAERIGVGYDAAYVNETPYDCVIDCRGFKRVGLDSPWIDGLAGDPLEIGARPVALQADGEEVYVIGPAAGIEFNAQERKANLNAVPENSTALFRYAGRTAALADALDAPAVQDRTTPPPASFRFENTIVSIGTDLTIDAERASVGEDAAGNALYVGDVVDVEEAKSLGESPVGPIIGKVDEVTIGVYLENAKGGSPRGAFTVGPVRVWGIGVDRVRLVKRGTPFNQLLDKFVTNDKTGEALFVGDRVSYGGRSADRALPVVGKVTATGSGGTLSLRESNYIGLGASGGYKVGDDIVYGVNPLNVELVSRNMDAEGYAARYADGQRIAESRGAFPNIKALTREARKVLDAGGTPVRDGNGNRLDIGDVVRVTRSGRYGEADARVTGYDGERVVMDLDRSTSTDDESLDGFEEGYKATPGRIQIKPGENFLTRLRQGKELERR